MSIAPANKASMAEGPALKLFHSIFTPDPIDFSNHPLLLPTIAWGCVIFGNAPTRITLCPATNAEELNNSARTARRPSVARTPSLAKSFRTPTTFGTRTPLMMRSLVMSLFPRGWHCHRQHTYLRLLSLVGSRPDCLGRPSRNQVGQRRALQNLGRGVPHIQEQLVQCAAVVIAIDQQAQLFRVPKRSKRPVNQPDDFAQPDLRRRPAQLVSALGAARALHDARILQFQQNQFQKLFRQVFFIGDVANPNRALPIMARQHHQRLQCVKPFLRHFHNSPLFIVALCSYYVYGSDRHYSKSTHNSKQVTFEQVLWPVVSFSYRPRRMIGIGCCARSCS